MQLRIILNFWSSCLHHPSASWAALLSAQRVRYWEEGLGDARPTLYHLSYVHSVWCWVYYRWCGTLLSIIHLIFLISIFLVFQDRASLCNNPCCTATSSCRPGWPRIHNDPPASASRWLGLKACATTAQPELFFVFFPFFKYDTLAAIYIPLAQK